MSVSQNLEQVRERIRIAAEAVGKSPESVRLIAVSKFQPVAAIREAYDAGQREFGENYVQELTGKSEELADLADIRWHLIGHLQRNKARKVVSIATAVQSLDSSELALELGKRCGSSEQERAQRLGVERTRLDVLVEVNIAGESQKSGAPPELVPRVIEAIEQQPALRLRGLMCVPPHSENAADARPHFDALRTLRDSLGGPERLPELSMGMTADLEHAISAGATLVRVGTAIFGDRRS
jgi:PLP dependent protein